MVRQFWSEIPLIPSSLKCENFWDGRIFLKFVYINKFACLLNARCFLGFSTLVLSLLSCCYFLMVLLVFFVLNKRQAFGCNGNIRGLY